MAERISDRRARQCVVLRRGAGPDLSDGLIEGRPRRRMVSRRRPLNELTRHFPFLRAALLAARSPGLLPRGPKGSAAYHSIARSRARGLPFCQMSGSQFNHCDNRRPARSLRTQASDRLYSDLTMLLGRAGRFADSLRLPRALAMMAGPDSLSVLAVTTPAGPAPRRGERGSRGRRRSAPARAHDRGRRRCRGGRRSGACRSTGTGRPTASGT